LFGAQQANSPMVAAGLAAGSAAVGRPLSGPAQLLGSDWSVVLRCTDPGRGTVIVKSYPDTQDGPGCFAAEAAGLSVSAGTGLAPALLGADLRSRTVVMTDLGAGPSMADVLLADSASAASTALLTWAAGCGALSAVTHERRAEFDTLRSGYLTGRPAESDAARMRARVLGVGERLAQVIAAPEGGLDRVQVPDGLSEDIRTVAQWISPSRFPVFSPGDMCPDNNLIVEAGIRFLDFESADVYSAFLDAAYIRMPFSTCWCVFRLPGELAAAAESAYREHIATVHPELASDEVWNYGVRCAVAAWSMSSMYWLLGRALTHDEPLEQDHDSPSARQVMRHRWQVLAAELEGGGVLPALAELARSMLSATERWQVPELPFYPAFRA